MKLVGYGLCGPGEADKYLEATLSEFKRVGCDEVIILGNNLGKNSKEEKLIHKFGYKLVKDDREWGISQNKIKEDFVKNHVSKLNPDWCVALDMDEILDSRFTRDSIPALEKIGDAFHFFIVDLWNDGWKEESSFWNVRLWQWREDLGFQFKNAPLHCGLAPEWCYHHHYFAPFILKHYGLKDKKHRDLKIARYEKYDPNKKYLDRKYYDMLKSDRFKPFNEEEVMRKISNEVASYNQHKKQRTMIKKEPRKFVYVRNSAGLVIDIPAEHLQATLKQPGMELVSEEIIDKAVEAPVIDKNPFECDICGTDGKTEKGLKNHMAKKHK